MPLTLVVTKAERDLIDTVWPDKSPERPSNEGLLTTFSPQNGARKRLSDRVIDLCGPGVLFEKPVDNQPDMFDNETSVSKEVD